MSEKYKFHDPYALYFVTLTVVNWISVFENAKMKLVLLDSLKFCQKEKGLIIHCWCIMTDHIHLIISKSGTQGSLGDIIRDFKKYTSKQIVNEILISDTSRSDYLHLFMEEASKIKRNKKYKVWQDGSHPILLDTNFLMDQKVEYIHFNPVKANLSSAPEDYKWSSAGDYYLNRKGMLKLELIG